jgi:tetratricopeptide (TPR) repeat protein
MAKTKAAQRRRKRPSPDARARNTRRELTSVESTMFFPRLRKQAKWMFVFLALAFAVGFVIFNVGSGGGGTGIGDLLLSPQGVGSDAPSAEESRERIEDNPNDVQAYRDLANALTLEGDVAGAISALEEYTGRRPKDWEPKVELARLYFSRGDRLSRQAQEAQLAAPAAIPGSLFAPPSKNPLSQALGQDPITQAEQTRVNTRLNDLFTRMQTEYKLAQSVYTDVARLRPRDASIQFELARAAESANDTEAAIAAYKRFLKLAPEDPSAPAVRERIKLLRAPATAGATG